ncbi:MAG: MqnA/MqnD/SBP family protein [Planctomycetota bacterium]
MSTTAPTRTLRLGHSPDPDDAFMWWPLANFTAPDGTRHTPQIDTAGYAFEHLLEDIESLNQRSAKAELEITALSIHQYAHVADQYALTTCGASMGDGYGPMIVAAKPMSVDEVLGRVAEAGSGEKLRVAVPGWRTSAWLSTQLKMIELGLDPTSQLLEQIEGNTLVAAGVTFQAVPFDEIIPSVTSSKFDAGIIIHEGQITYADEGMHLVEDLGKWWCDSRGLPLPLGGNAIRRDLVDAGEGPTIARVLLDSITHALANRRDAVSFAMQWGRGLDRGLADRFVGMYVNDRTLDYGDEGRAAVERMLREAADAGLVPGDGKAEFIAPGPPR